MDRHHHPDSSHLAAPQRTPGFGSGTDSASNSRHSSRNRAPPPLPLKPAHSTFITRSASDDAGELARRTSLQSEEEMSRPANAIERAAPSAITERTEDEDQGYDPEPESAALPKSGPSFSRSLAENMKAPFLRRRPSVGRRKANGKADGLRGDYLNEDVKEISIPVPRVRPGALANATASVQKLGTLAGVFVPTTLNVLSILMFLRFGFILGQAGVLGMMGMLVASYLIDIVTTLSLSAIATNGTVRGGGAYYLISRSLGPEFGGSIGVVFYLGSVFSTGMNAVGLVDCFKQNFGSVGGNWGNWLNEGFWWEYLWASAILVLCTATCLAGSAIFARASNGLLVILLVATFSIPASALFKKPFEDAMLGINFTGLSGRTLVGNFMPHFTRGAAGSQLKGRETYQDLFGILFPATGGIFAGASMSGDLKHPSKAIPKGTLSGLALTFIAYTLVIFAMAASITRQSFYNDINIIQNTNLSGSLILLGEFAASFFSSLMGVIGSAKLLQALARDNILPGFQVFGKGTKKTDDPVLAIFVTWTLAQLVMFLDLNMIASFVTMTYLMTFLVMNLACFLLKLSSAPNFRPSFKYFNKWTAGVGTLVSGAVMFFVDGSYASACVAVMIFVFLIIHYTTPPKSWGDVSQSLIYHQVRKYLLRLRQEHVKFWRPQILLLINDPRTQYRLVQFCNSLKKGSLFVLGHVIVSQDFGPAVPEARKQQHAWTKYIDFSKVKAFINVAIAPTFDWGARNIVLGAGLGGMRPNIVVMGAFDLDGFKKSLPLIDHPTAEEKTKKRENRPTTHISNGQLKSCLRKTRSARAKSALPTDFCNFEGHVSPCSYVTVLEDLLLNLQINVALAKNFKNLEYPAEQIEKSDKRYIDLWPIQMSAEIAQEGTDGFRNVLTTNFDTYTLILQLGCILNTVPSWKSKYQLRVAVFVEYESDVEEERSRVETLLNNLRITAEVLVFWLASGEVRTYQMIVNGDTENAGKDIKNEVDATLEDEEWWQSIQKIRSRRNNVSVEDHIRDIRGLYRDSPRWPAPSFQSPASTVRTPASVRFGRFGEWQSMMRSNGVRRASTADFAGNTNFRMSITSNRIPDPALRRHSAWASASESSGEDETDNTLAADTEEDSEPNSPLAIRRGRSNGEILQPLPEEVTSPDSMEAPMLPVSQRRPAVTPGAIPSDMTNQTGAPFLQQMNNSETSPSSQTLVTPDAPNSSSGTPAVLSRRSSSQRVLSRQTQPTEIPSDDNATGPSISFNEPAITPSPHTRLPNTPGYRSIYGRHFRTGENTPRTSNLSSAGLTTGTGNSSMQVSPFTTAAMATGGLPHSSSVATSAAAIPLGFNDLPSRAQHLILNELIRTHSTKEHTAIVFTTLPSPMKGTCKSEGECVSYLGDLEVLTQNLPPVLLVHSNSLTVTMNL